MEDFGYKKNSNSDQKNNFLAKRVFLISATLLSLSAFFYITLNAYYFISQNNTKEIETIKGPELPIKVYENDDYNQKNDRIINRSIYDDIFGNRKEIIREDIKIKKNSEPPLPPKNSPQIIDALEADLKLGDKKPAQIAEPEEEEEDIKNKKQIGENLRNNTRNTEDYPITLPNQINREAETKNIPRKRSSIKVQISAMSSKENCEEYLYKLKKLHPEVFSGTKHYVEEANLGRRGIFYRLQIGDFVNQIQAEEFCNRFIAQTQKSSSECIIVE